MKKIICLSAIAPDFSFSGPTGLLSLPTKDSTGH